MDITITGKSILDNTDMNMAVNFNLLSANATETLTGMSSLIRNENVIRLFPQAGLTLTLVHAKDIAAVDVFRLSGGEDKVLVGSNGDWIELIRINNKWYQGNAQVYLPEPTSVTKFVRDVDFRVLGNLTLMRTADTDLHFFMTKIDFIAKTLTKPGNINILNPFVHPTISIGHSGPSYTDVADNFLLDLSGALSFMANMVNGDTPAIPGNTDIVLKKINAGNATAYVGHVRILGFYFKI